jgi:ketosteroid isomerase-like protein
VAAATNPELAKQLVASLRESGVDAVADLLDDGIRMEMPFAPQGTPSSVVGKAAVMEALTFIPRYFARFRISAHECYECKARDTVILECTSFGIYRAPQAPEYQNRYVLLLTFAGGRVTRWREFFNPYPVLASAPYLG